MPGSNGVERQPPVLGAVSGNDAASDLDSGGAPMAFVMPQDLMNTSGQGWATYGLDDL